MHFIQHMHNVYTVAISIGLFYLGILCLSSICNGSCSIYSKLWACWRTLLYVLLHGHIRKFSKKMLEIVCNDCSFILIVVLNIVFLYNIAGQQPK